jgi:hypothetical protein
VLIVACSTYDTFKEGIYNQLEVALSLAAELDKATAIITSYSIFVQDVVAEGAHRISRTSYVFEGVGEPDSFEKIILKLRPDRNSESFDKIMKELTDAATWAVMSVVHNSWGDILKTTSQCTVFTERLKQLDLKRIKREFIARKAEHAWLLRVEPKMTQIRVSIKMGLGRIYEVVSALLQSTSQEWREIAERSTAAPSHINTVKDARVAFSRAFHRNCVTMIDADSFQQAIMGIYNASIRDQSRSVHIKRQTLEKLSDHLQSLEALGSFMKSKGRDGVQGVPVVEFDDYNILTDILEFGVLGAGM